MNYLLAGDSNGCIHAIQDGVIRKTIVAGSVVNTVSLKNQRMQVLMMTLKIIFK